MFQESQPVTFYILQKKKRRRKRDDTGEPESNINVSLVFTLFVNLSIVSLLLLSRACVFLLLGQVRSKQFYSSIAHGKSVQWPRKKFLDPKNKVISSFCIKFLSKEYYMHIFLWLYLDPTSCKKTLFKQYKFLEYFPSPFALSTWFIILLECKSVFVQRLKGMWPMPKVKVNYGPLQVTFILKLLANAGLLRWSPSLWFLYSNDLMIIKCRNKEHIFSRETVGHPRNTHYTGWFSSSFLETDVWNPFFHCVYLSFIHLLVLHWKSYNVLFVSC